MTVFEKIEAQQKGKENTAIWMVGEQLKDICRADLACAAIVAEDLENEDMTIEAAAEKIKEYADDQHRKLKNDQICVPPNVAEQIIREFFGLPSSAASAAANEGQAIDPIPANSITSGLLDLDIFL